MAEKQQQQQHLEDQKQESMERKDQNSQFFSMVDTEDLIQKLVEHRKQESMEQKDNVDVHPLVLKFLGKDNSFLSPWSWDPEACNKTETTSSSSSSSRPCNTEIMQFQEGSFFAREAFDFIKPKEPSSK